MTTGEVEGPEEGPEVTMHQLPVTTCRSESSRGPRTVTSVTEVVVVPYPL